MGFFIYAFDLLHNKIISYIREFGSYFHIHLNAEKGHRFDPWLNNTCNSKCCCCAIILTTNRYKIENFPNHRLWRFAKYKCNVFYYWTKNMFTLSHSEILNQKAYTHCISRNEINNLTQVLP